MNYFTEDGVDRFLSGLKQTSCLPYETINFIAHNVLTLLLNHLVQMFLV